MAEPGDPPPTNDLGDDHDDDLIGFASPASLEGRLRLEPEPEPEPEPELDDGPDPDLLEMEAADEAPFEAGLAFAPSREFSTRRRRRRRDEGAAIPGGGLGLYAVYALILFAVPTVGVSAVVALVAVTGRAGPDDDLSSSHFIYQRRTLWIAVVAAIVGVVFSVIGLFALGPGILFFLALWIILRGAWGVWTLKSGRAIADPRGWWI